MPGKRKLLPQPCPVCKRKYGTVQFVVFQLGGIICRIGHYSSKRYNQAVYKSKQDRSNFLVDYNPEKDKRNAQRIWHSFRSERDFYEIERKVSKWEQENGYIQHNKSITFPMFSPIYQTISDFGWHMKSNQSSNYKGRTRKHLDF